MKETENLIKKTHNWTIQRNGKRERECMIQWTINTVSNHERERKDASYNGGHKKKPIMRETEMEEEREREREDKAR